jgi:hypothetical protein
VPLDKKKVDPESVTLVEVGPRFCLNPVRIFDGSFGGRTLYENPAYVSPNAVGVAAGDNGGVCCMLKEQAGAAGQQQVSLRRGTATVGDGSLRCIHSADRADATLCAPAMYALPLVRA